MSWNYETCFGRVFMELRISVHIRKHFIYLSNFNIKSTFQKWCIFRYNLSTGLVAFVYVHVILVSIFKKWLIKAYTWFYFGNYVFLSFLMISNSFSSTFDIQRKFCAPYYLYDFEISRYNVVLMFIHKWRTWAITGESRIII